MDIMSRTIFILIVTEGAFHIALQKEQTSVHLEPEYVKVCEGASVTINCTFQPHEIYKVSWHYSQTPVSDCTSAKRIPEEQRFIKEDSKAWSTLNITFINANDSGWYFCKVIQDIPVLIENCSNGTQVIVDSAFHGALQEEHTRVHLEPKYVNVYEGDSVTINCTFQPREKYIVSWYYSQTPVSDCTSAKRIPEEQRFIKEDRKAWSTLNIPFINTNDSGWYFCKVTQVIPVLIENCSNGTQFIVDSAFHIALQEEQTSVHLEPEYVKVYEGASVTINCTFQPREKYKVSWHYSQTLVSDCTSAKRIPVEQRFITEKSKAWSTLNITFINANDSGWYFCKVTQDIPVLIENSSNRIQILVKSTWITACLNPK